MGYPVMVASIVPWFIPVSATGNVSATCAEHCKHLRVSGILVPAHKATREIIVEK